MKSYFEKLQSIGLEAVVGLRRLDAQHAELHANYHEDYMKGNLTPQGYGSLIKSLDKQRENYITQQLEKVNAVKVDYHKAVDAYIAPSAGRMHMDDIELLKQFELSTGEFESLAEKYRDNPTMGRLLEKYRTDHNVDTNWRFQTGNKRKEIFNRLCGSVESIMKQNDKYSPDREGTLLRNTATYYHQLQGSNADDLPIPEASENTGSTKTFF